MATPSPAWIGRKERSLKDNPARASFSSKTSSYASSHLLCELNSIVSLFTEEQSKIAQSTGFRSFSKPTHPIQFDRQFTVWLMPKVDIMSRSIRTSVGKRIMMFQEDTALVFGIPCSGKEVWDASLDKSQEMRNKIEEIIGMDEYTRSPNAAAWKTLRALAGHALTAEEAVKFKISFTVVVVGLLCDSNIPGEKDSVNYWPALKDQDQIHKFNWSSYVLDAVFSACAYDFAPEALQFCRSFDGVKQGGRLTSPMDDLPTPPSLLFDLLHLKNNTGKLPQEFIQDLDE